MPFASFDVESMVGQSNAGRSEYLSKAQSYKYLLFFGKIAFFRWQYSHLYQDILMHFANMSFIVKIF